MPPTDTVSAEADSSARLTNWLRFTCADVPALMPCSLVSVPAFSVIAPCARMPVGVVTEPSRVLFSAAPCVCTDRPPPDCSSPPRFSSVPLSTASDCVASSRPPLLSSVCPRASITTAAPETSPRALISEAEPRSAVCPAWMTPAVLSIAPCARSVTPPCRLEIRPCWLPSVVALSDTPCCASSVPPAFCSAPPVVTLSVPSLPAQPPRLSTLPAFSVIAAPLRRRPPWLSSVPLIVACSAESLCIRPLPPLSRLAPRTSSAPALATVPPRLSMPPVMLSSAPPLLTRLPPRWSRLLPDTVTPVPCVCALTSVTAPVAAIVTAPLARIWPELPSSEPVVTVSGPLPAAISVPRTLSTDCACRRRPVPAAWMRPSVLSSWLTIVAVSAPVAPVCVSEPPTLRQSVAVMPTLAPLSVAASVDSRPALASIRSPAPATIARSRRSAPRPEAPVELIDTDAACRRLSCSCRSPPRSVIAPAASIDPADCSVPVVRTVRSPCAPSELSGRRPAASVPAPASAGASTVSEPCAPIRPLLVSV